MNHVDDNNLKSFSILLYLFMGDPSENLPLKVDIL